MEFQLSDRMLKPDFIGTFLSSILKAAGDPSIISFAGGLPNPSSFPVKEMDAAAQKVLDTKGVLALQYSGTQGYLPLRQFVADRYKKVNGLDYSPDEIIITNGSQQALDMISACMINDGDDVMVEDPSYLAALQTFHLYNPNIVPVELREDGINTDQLAELVKDHPAKFFYVIPNFQNPTGLTYSQEVREKMVEIIRGTNIMILEDNPYGELRFSGSQLKGFGSYLGEQCTMLGTFSKIVAPGMRLGWIAVKNAALREKLLSYKSTMDLHTNIFCQVILEQYLQDNDVDKHIEVTKELYRAKAQAMMDAMEKYFPAGVEYTKPQGGMFLWVTLPEGLKAIDVYYKAIEKGVAVCPGDPFYETQRDVRTMRLNYSNSTDEQIDTGIQILANCMKELLA